MESFMQGNGAYCSIESLTLWHVTLGSTLAFLRTGSISASKDNYNFPLLHASVASSLDPLP